MSNSRIVSLLCLGALLGALLLFACLYALGWRLTVPAVILVNVADQSIVPVLRIGQELRWEGIKDGAPFTVKFRGGLGPCASTSIKSDENHNPHVAKCTVILLPTSQHHFGYTIEKSHEINKTIVRPCDGCYFYADSEAFEIAEMKVALQHNNLIDFDCDETSNQVSLTPQRVNINDVAAKKLKWTASPNIATFQVAFKNALDPVCKGATCDFTNSHAFPYDYTVKAPLTGSCANLSAPGVVTSVVTGVVTMPAAAQ